MRIIHQLAIKSVRKFVFAFFVLAHDDDNDEENKYLKRVSHNFSGYWSSFPPVLTSLL